MRTMRWMSSSGISTSTDPSSPLAMDTTSSDQSVTTKNIDFCERETSG